MLNYFSKIPDAVGGLSEDKQTPMERLKNESGIPQAKPLLSLPQFSLQVTYEQQLLFSATNLSHIHIQSKMIF